MNAAALLSKSLALLKSGIGALVDPTRQDLVAAVGELSSTMTPLNSHALRQMRDRMLVDPVGRHILRTRPIVSSETVNLQELSSYAKGSFGRAYYDFLAVENVSPDTRTPVKYISADTTAGSFNTNDELAYVMLRYRQIHDYIHTLTAVPTTLAGELALKWFEYQQFSLPMNLMAGTVGSIRLLPFWKFNDLNHHSKFQGTTGEELAYYLNVLVPWALQSGSRAKFLLNIDYEKCFKMDLEELRQHLNIIPFKHPE